jgi:twitching motility protein PilT
MMLADTLKLIVSQQLIQTADGNGRRAVVEVLINNDAAASMIRASKTHQLSQVIQSGAKEGMQSLDAQLKELAQNGIITGEAAYHHAIEKLEFERFLAMRNAA